MHAQPHELREALRRCARAPSLHLQPEKCAMLPLPAARRRRVSSTSRQSWASQRLLHEVLGASQFSITIVVTYLGASIGFGAEGQGIVKILRASRFDSLRAGACSRVVGVLREMRSVLQFLGQFTAPPPARGAEVCVFGCGGCTDSLEHYCTVFVSSCGPGCFTVFVCVCVCVGIPL